MRISECRALFAVSLALLAVSSAARAADRANVEGKWKEYWGAPGQQSLSYSDTYQITVTPDGQASIAILDRDQKIEDVTLKDNGVTFTQHTDFSVAYALSLQADNDWLVGTATTPNKVVNVRWQRIK